MLKFIANSMLGLLIVLSVGGFKVNMHYCQQQLFDVGIFSEATSCCAPSTNAHQHACCSADMQGNGHCEDKHLEVNSLDDFTVTASTIKLTAPQNVTLLTQFHTATDSFLHIAQQHTSIHRHGHPPPARTLPARVQLQVFLI